MLRSKACEDSAKSLPAAGIDDMITLVEKQIKWKRGYFSVLNHFFMTLPGTGAWTGELVASLLDVRMRTAIPAIFAGLLIAGVIILAISCGVGSLF